MPYVIIIFNIALNSLFFGKCSLNAYVNSLGISLIFYLSIKNQIKLNRNYVKKKFFRQFQSILSIFTFEYFHYIAYE